MERETVLVFRQNWEMLEGRRVLGRRKKGENWKDKSERLRYDDVRRIEWIRR